MILAGYKNHDPTLTRGEATILGELKNDEEQESSISIIEIVDFLIMYF